MITRFSAIMRGYHNPKRDMGKSYDDFWKEFVLYLRKKKKYKEVLEFIEENEGACVYILVHSFKKTLHL